MGFFFKLSLEIILNLTPQKQTILIEMWVVRKSLNVNELLSLGLVFHFLPVLSEFSSREDWHELFAILFTQKLNCVERTFDFNYYQTWTSIEDDKTESAVIWLRKLTCWPKLNSITNQPHKPISVIATLSGELISSDQEWCRWVSPPVPGRLRGLMRVKL